MNPLASCFIPLDLQLLVGLTVGVFFLGVVWCVDTLEF